MCRVITGYQSRVSAPGPATTDLTFCTKPQDPPWIPFSKSPAPPFSFKIYSPTERERRWKRWGRGGTVRQLFTVVLSSYFTRKQSHSYLNSSSWPVSSSVCNTFLHRDVYCTLCPSISVLCRCKCHQTLHRVSVLPSVDLYLKGDKILPS